MHYLILRKAFIIYSQLTIEERVQIELNINRKKNYVDLLIGLVLI